MNQRVFLLLRGNKFTEIIKFLSLNETRDQVKEGYINI